MNQHFDQHEGAEKHVFDTTVDLQVMVECDEVFGVWDATTGVLLQGTDGTTRQRLWHLVRMETCISTTVRQPPNAFFPTWSSEFRDPWQLTDIDDLLGPTTWYHGTVKPFKSAKKMVVSSNRSAIGGELRSTALDASCPAK